MGYFTKVKDFKVKPRNKPEETVQDILKYPIMAITERGLTKETCEKFGVRTGLSEKDGKTPEAYYFPQYNQKGTVVGFKKRDITVPKEDEGHWSAIGSVSVGHKLFGQEACETNPRKRTMLILCEGEEDMMSIWQACTDSVKGTKYAGLEPMVVSITLGTKNAVENVLRNKGFIDSFESVAFFFDDDYCTPQELKRGAMKGHEARDAVAGALLGGHLQMWTFVPTNGFKDASDYLQAGKSELLAKTVQFEKRPYSAQKIVKASDVSLEEIMAPRPEGIYVKEFPGLMEKIHGFRTREFVMVTAPSGCVDANTEFLTKSGWKKISEYSSTDLVGQYTDRGELQFVKPLQYIKLPCKELNSVKTQLIDMQLCDDHTFVYFTRGSNTPRKMLFSEVMRKHSENSRGFSGQIATTFKYSGTGVDMTEGELRLQVAVMADGRIVREGANNYTQMRFTKERKYRRLIDLCTQFNLKFKDNGLSGTVRKQYEVIVWPKCRDKFFDAKYWNCTSEQLAIICDEVLKWDGCESTQQYSSTRPGDADFIQFAFATIGRRSTVGRDSRIEKYTNEYPGVVNINRRGPKAGLCGGSTSKAPIVKVPTTDGFKYCFQVPSGMLVLRRNGRIFITGNCGKSTVVSFFSNAFIAEGERVGQIYLEETNKETLQRAIASKLKVNYLKFKNNPTSVASMDRIEQAYKEITEDDKVVMLSHFGSLPISELMNKIKHMHFVEGCRYIILDHLSMVISGSDVQDERKELDMVCTELAAFCAANDVCVIAVAHLNRSAAEMFKPPKGKENEPFWVRITKEMMRGSSALEQLAFIVIGLEPEIMPDRSRGRVRFTVLKNRPWSYLGAADEFELDDDSWEVILSEREGSGF